MKLFSNIGRILQKRVRVDSRFAMVSFTFDDAPISSFVNGGRILEQYGYRGTYYVCAGLFRIRSEVGRIAGLETLIDFKRRGHEIANHTYSHIDCKNSCPLNVIRSVRKNRRKLEGIVSRNFSYPYGSTNLAARFSARLYSSSARGISFGINKENIEMMNLKSNRIYDRLGIESGLKLVDECSNEGGWLIFYTHDVCNDPSDYGCTPEQFRKVVQSVNKKGLMVWPVQNAVEKINRINQRK